MHAPAATKKALYYHTGEFAEVHYNSGLAGLRPRRLRRGTQDLRATLRRQENHCIQRAKYAGRLLNRDGLMEHERGQENHDNLIKRRDGGFSATLHCRETRPSTEAIEDAAWKGPAKTPDRVSKKYFPRIEPRLKDQTSYGRPNEGPFSRDMVCAHLLEQSDDTSGKKNNQRKPVPHSQMHRVFLPSKRENDYCCCGKSKANHLRPCRPLM